jgi:glyoxylase-like metal-dependent hydrolase (beta-lactamase superfamily II)
MSSLVIADRWFERRRVGDDITLLWEPHVHPLIRCNIWVVRGRDKYLLIDTGIGAKSVKDEIRDIIDKPVLAVATHIHYDHVGGLHEFEVRLMHAIEAPRMADYRQRSPLLKSEFPKQALDDLRSVGYAIDDDALLTALPHPDFKLEGYAVRPTTPNRVVEEGDIVDIGDRHFEVLHLPGHSPGSIGLWEEASGILFSGDAIYDGPLLDELSGSNITDYINTMKRLRALPVKVVHGGHDKSFGRERLIEIADAYIAYRDKNEASG